jgi:glycosyltransferase involved in cell wall biosynthesis
MSDSDASVGLAHDYLLVMRGAERTFAEIAACWPEAPIYTALYSEEGTDHRFESHQVVTSPLQRLRLTQRSFRWFLPAYPLAIASLPIGDHEVVISSSSAFAHGVKAGAGAIHVCYCHTPFRYIWHERERALAEVPPLLRPALRRLLPRMRAWDREAAAAVTSYVANSELARQRIADFYDRDSVVVHPPVEIDRFTTGQPGEYFLLVSELVAHKRVEVALEAARLARARLVVVGHGPEAARLARMYGGAEFRGRVEDADLARLYAGCRATIVPSVEEFGIVAVECQAAGRPVIATDAGGARETVINGRTGVLVPGGAAIDFAEVISSTDFERFDPLDARRSAERFAPRRFRERFRAAVDLAGC